MDAIKTVYSLLSFKEKIRFLKIFLLIFIMTMLETFGIALVLPAIKVLISENFYLTINEYLEPIFNKSFEKKEVIIYGLLFILFYYIFKFFFVAFTVYKQLHFNFSIINSNSKKLYWGYLNQDYENYTMQNSSLLVRNVTSLVEKFGGLLENCFTILTDIALFVSVIIFLIFLDASGTLVIFIVFGIIALAYYYGTKQRFTKWGKLAVNYEYLKIKYLYEGLTGLKDIKIKKKEDFFLKSFLENVSSHGKLTLIRNFIKILPKQTYEIIGVFSLVVLSMNMIYRDESINNFLPIAGVFAIAAFKILPSGNRLLLAFQSFRFHLAGIKILKEEYKQIDIFNSKNKNINKSIDLDFKDRIEIKNVKFEYKSRKKIILKNVNLSIKVNDSVGIIGESGSGKSTLVDIIIGLYKPTDGLVLCDNKNIHQNIDAWFKMVGYVPQNIYLFDDSIAKNIAFGVSQSEIDFQRIKECLIMTKLLDWVNELPDGLDTIVGDKGIRVSGGQKQRIGIARALYSRPKILFFDEATSSLDINTENQLIKEINESLTNITKVMISHRMNTLVGCNNIYKIENQNIKKIDKYF
jgi:ABC-type bacteriocin/lantibiotic exporter with double-glycine peptidase domain